MKKLLFLIIGICIAVSCIGAVFALLGAVLGVTVGIFGVVFGGAMKILFSPAILVLIIIVLAYKLNKKVA